MITNIIKSTVIMFLLDAIYLTSISSGFKKMIINIQGSEMDFRIIPTIVCYIALIFGLNYFVLNTDKSLRTKLIDAFFLGIVIYTVYETTNYAVLKNWELWTVILDSIWGGVLFSLTTLIVEMM